MRQVGAAGKSWRDGGVMEPTNTNRDADSIFEF